MAGFRAAIFDVDGVLVDSPHEEAWRRSLQDLMDGPWRKLRDRTAWTPEAFTAQVYQEHLSGKPRAAGARDALHHFGVPDADRRVGEYADRKQAMVERLIDAGDFTAYPDALRFIIDAASAGMLVAAASSSKNAGRLLAKIRVDELAAQEGITSPSIRPGLTLRDLFDVDVSGRDFRHGKPHPEMFLAAAEALGVDPSSAVVLEDAAAGVRAAKAGGMAAIGIARADDAELLIDAGADLVVTTLDEVNRSALREGRLAMRRPGA
jgi:beta-phosphoglucomutase